MYDYRMIEFFKKIRFTYEKKPINEKNALCRKRTQSCRPLNVLRTSLPFLLQFLPKGKDLPSEEVFTSWRYKEVLLRHRMLISRQEGKEHSLQLLILISIKTVVFPHPTTVWVAYFAWYVTSVAGRWPRQTCSDTFAPTLGNAPSSATSVTTAAAMRPTIKRIGPPCTRPTLPSCEVNGIWEQNIAKQKKKHLFWNEKQNVLFEVNAIWEQKVMKVLDPPVLWEVNNVWKKKLFGIC